MNSEKKQISINLGDIKSSCTLNPLFKEECPLLETRELKTDYYGVVAKEKIHKWQIIGRFEPISVLKNQEIFEHEYPIWAYLMEVKIRDLLSSSSGRQSPGADSSSAADQQVIEEIWSKIHPRKSMDDLAKMDSTELNLTFQNKLRMNCFADKGKNKYLYYTPSFINHSCTPNCILEFNSTQMAALVAIVDLPAGGEVTIAYGFWPTYEAAQQELKLVYEFVCSCSICTRAIEDSPSEWTERHLLAPVTVCGHCGKGGSLKKCGGCQVLKYCSRDCQRAHWQQYHRHNCQKMKRLKLWR